MARALRNIARACHRQFAVPAIANATEEIALADRYPLIRLFTVGQKTASSAPLDDLQTIEQVRYVPSFGLGRILLML